MGSMAGHACTRGGMGIVLKRALLVFIVGLFFCDIAVYLSLAVSPRLQPQYWIALLVVLASVLAWYSPSTRWEVFRTPLFVWCVLFFVLTLVFFAVVPASHIEQLKERTRDVVLLMAFLGVFLMLSRELDFLRRLVILAVLLGVAINLITLVHNGFLRPASVTWDHRPGGFYINSNESAIALILGMIVSVGVLRPRWRASFAIFTLVGVAATFSREGAIGWVVAVVCLGAFGVIGWKSLGLHVLGFVVCAGVVILLLPELHLIKPGLLHYYYLEIYYRSFGYFEGVPLDSSIRDRITLMKAGWHLFLGHPWIGNGLGSTYHWSLPLSTHNMYLLYMDDYGVIGAVLYPLIIWCMVREATGETRKIAWTMAVFLLFWGLLDHNIVQNYYSLFAISLTAAMSRISTHEGGEEVAPIPVGACSG